MKDRLSVTVKFGDYTEIVTSDDPAICASVISMITEHQKEQPKTAEEIIRQDFEEKLEEQTSARNSAEYAVRNLTKKLEDSKLELEEQRKRVLDMVNTEPAT